MLKSIRIFFILQFLFTEVINIVSCLALLILLLKSYFLLCSSIMRTFIYITTFITYISSSASFMVYFMNKFNLKQTYQISDLQISILDSSLPFFMMLGSIFKLRMFDGLSPSTTLLVANLPIAAGFLILSTLSILVESGSLLISNIQSMLILIICCFLVQITRAAIWPEAMAMVSQFYSENTKMLGFWSSAWQFGSIFGLTLTNLFIFTVGVRWQCTYLILCFPGILITLLLYYRMQLIEEQNQKIREKLSANSNNAQNTNSSFWQYVKSKLSHKTSVVYYLVSGMMSALFHQLVFWLPYFFYNIGLGQHSGYITIFLDLGGICGSFLLGIDPSTDSSSQNTNLFNRFYITRKYQTCVTLAIVFSLAFFICEANVITFMGLTFLLGFLVGGVYNLLVSKDLVHQEPSESRAENHLIESVEENQQDTQPSVPREVPEQDVCKASMLTTITNSLAMIIFNLLTGFVLSVYELMEQKGGENVKQTGGGTESLQLKDGRNKYNMLFVVVILLQVACLCLLIKRTSMKLESRTNCTQLIHD